MQWRCVGRLSNEQQRLHHPDVLPPPVSPWWCFQSQDNSANRRPAHHAPGRPTKQLLPNFGLSSPVPTPQCLECKDQGRSWFWAGCCFTFSSSTSSLSQHRTETTNRRNKATQEVTWWTCWTGLTSTCSTQSWLALDLFASSSWRRCVFEPLGGDHAERVYFSFMWCTSRAQIPYYIWEQGTADVTQLHIREWLLSSSCLNGAGKHITANGWF